MKSKRISVKASVLFGKPHIQGTRVSVEQILAALAEGMTYKEVMKEFSITNDDIKACMDFAHKSVSRTHFVNTSGKAYA